MQIVVERLFTSTRENERNTGIAKSTEGADIQGV